MIQFSNRIFILFLIDPNDRIKIINNNIIKFNNFIFYFNIILTIFGKYFFWIQFSYT